MVFNETQDKITKKRIHKPNRHRERKRKRKMFFFYLINEIRYNGQYASS